MATATIGGNGAFPWSPVVDGVVVDHDPMAAIGPGSSSTIPVMIGTNGDKMQITRRLLRGVPPLTLSKLIEGVEAIIGSQSKGIVDGYAIMYPGSSPDDLWDAIVSDLVFGLPPAEFVDHRISVNAPTWTYRFNWKAHAAGGTYGAAHTVEIPFVFGTFEATGVADFLDRPRSESEHLSAQMQEAWVNFARGGRPDTNGLPESPPCTASTRPTMIFDSQCGLAEIPIGPTHNLWDTVQRT
jgi:para-nitrobenzyl esterase